MKSFEASQYAQGSGKGVLDFDGADTHGTYYGELASDQAVPVKASSSPESAQIVAPYMDLTPGRYVTERSVQSQDREEKCLVGDVKVSLDKIVDKCGNCGKCEKNQAKYESKLKDLREYYDKQLEDMAESTSIQQEDKRCLMRSLDLQTKEKQMKEEEIRQLKHQVEELEAHTRREQDKLNSAIRLKEREMNQLKCLVGQLQSQSKKEQDELRSAISLKEKELHDMKQLASCCPVYSKKMRRANFEQKRDLCAEIDSLVKQLFISKNPDEKNRLCRRIQAKLTRFSPLERSRSFSM